MQTIFTALDGEGYTVGNKHYYNLLMAVCAEKDGTRFLLPSSNPDRLTTWEILKFLRELPAYKGATYVTFYFSYDVTKWLEDLTVAQKKELFKTGQVSIYSRADQTFYTIKYIPRKIFILSWFTIRDGKFREFKVTIYDVFGFFQCSFIKALENWGIGDIQFIELMKKKRPNFKRESIDKIVQYTYDECFKLCELMNKVRDALHAENIDVTQWYGAGAVATAILKRENAQKDIVFQTVSPSTIKSQFDGKEYSFLDAILGSYYGGRFEIFRQGIISSSHQYDINSAYPYAMSTLPSMENANVRYSRDYKSTATYSIWWVKYDVETNGNVPFIGPFPYRTKDKHILYPYKNAYGTWVHQSELQTAIRLYGRKCFQICGGFILFPNENRPFGFINELAYRRLILKKAGDERNIVIKLGLNSLYGKTAQGQIEESRTPPFLNYYVAGYITAFTRAQLLEEAWYCGNKGSDIIWFATDAFISRTPSKKLGTISSSEFGAWEYTPISIPVCYVQPGVAYSRNPRIKKHRTRGFRVDAISSEKVFAEWNKNGTDGFVTGKETQFYGIGSCMALNSFSKYGRFIEEENQLNFSPPPTKHIASNGYPMRGANVYEYIYPRIEGISRREINDVNRKYEILIPYQSDVIGPSIPYEPKAVRELPIDPRSAIRQQMLANIKAYDMPDDIQEEYEDNEV